MDITQAFFSGWALVELFGHQKEVGFVTTQYFGDKAMFQIDIPDLPADENVTLKRPEYVDGEFLPAGAIVRREAVPGRSRIVNPGAVYAMNPCTEEAARAELRGLTRRSIAVVSLPPGAQLPAGETDDDLDDEQDEEL